MTKRAVAVLAAVLTFAGSAFAANFLLTKTAETTSTVTLSYPAQAGADGYRYYAPGTVSGSACDGTRVARTFDVAKLSVRFAKVPSGTYCVEAIVLTPVGAAQYPAVTPPTGDVQPPSAPPNLVFSLVTQNGLTLGWGDSTDNVAVTNYRIYRDAVLIGQGPGSSGGFANTWADTNLVCNTSYVYGVEAQDTAGNTSVRSTAAVTTAACSGPPPPPPSNASVFLAPAGNDSNPCTQPSPCRTLTRGYAAVASGGTVELGDGFYPCVTLSGSKQVTFSAAAGSRPWVACNSTIRGLYSDGFSLQFVNAANITMNGIYAAGVEWKEGTGVHDITFNDVHVTCLSNDTAHFQLWGGLCNAKIEGAAVNLTMNGGEVGPTIDNELGSYPGSSRIMGGSNIVLNGVTFHHNEREPGGHSECLMIEGGNPVKVINSRFLSCNTYNIFITCFPCANGSYGSQPDNILIENNYFGPGPQYYAIELRDTNPRTRVDYRYNTFYKFVGVGPGYGDFRGNIIAHSGGCPGSGYTVKYNVWGDDLGRTCGDSTNISVPSSSFTTDGAGYDLATGHLGSASAAIGRGDPTDFPATDIDGQTRPIGAVDAGADER